jgi:glycosyltransferase involved in cell wall biosynthesis
VPPLLISSTSNMYSHLIFLTRGEITGGASVFALDMYEILIENGFTPLLVHGCESDSLGKYCDDNNIQHLSLPALSNHFCIANDCSSVLQIFNLVASYPLATIILNSAKAAFLGRLVCTILSRKCLYVVHGWPYTGWRYKPLRLIYLLVELTAEIIFGRFTSFVYVSSYDMRNRPFSILNLFNPNRGIVIHNSTSRTYAENQSTRASPDTRSPHLEIVTVSRLEAQKDVASLIKAVSLLPETSLTIIGSGPQQDMLISYVHQLGVSDRICFLGALPRSEVKYQLQQADVFALISNWEGFPISTVEAMSCSLPIIVSDVGGAAEVFDFVPELPFGFRIGNRNRLLDLVYALCQYLLDDTLFEHSRNSFYVYQSFLSRRQYELKYLSCLASLGNS